MFPNESSPGGLTPLRLALVFFIYDIRCRLRRTCVAVIAPNVCTRNDRWWYVRVTSSLRKERRAVLREIYDSLCTHDLGLLARTKSMHVHRAVVRPYRQEIGYSVRLRVKCCSNRKIQHPNIYFPPRYLRESKFLARFRAGCCCCRRFDHLSPP